MNLASKLGEDLARAGEVLLTKAAFAKFGRAGARFESKRATFGALRFPYCRAR